LETYLHFFLLYIFERTIDAGELDLAQRLVKLGVSWTLGIVQGNSVFQNTTQSLIHYFFLENLPISWANVQCQTPKQVFEAKIF
jgi:hypothetical protein